MTMTYMSHIIVINKIFWSGEGGGMSHIFISFISFSFCLLFSNLNLASLPYPLLFTSSSHCSLVAEIAHPLGKYRQKRAMGSSLILRYKVLLIYISISQPIKLQVASHMGELFARGRILFQIFQQAMIST